MFACAVVVLLLYCTLGSSQGPPTLVTFPPGVVVGNHVPFRQVLFSKPQAAQLQNNATHGKQRAAQTHHTDTAMAAFGDSPLSSVRRLPYSALREENFHVVRRGDEPTPERLVVCVCGCVGCVGCVYVCMPMCGCVDVCMCVVCSV
jgi:hypothetical protein